MQALAEEVLAHSAQGQRRHGGVLEVYTRPCDPRLPQVCLDEAGTQLLDEVQPPLPARPATPEHHGTPVREDH